MDEVKLYKTAGAFRVALETRLQARALSQGTDLQRLRRQVAFDRLLARMFSKGRDEKYPWVLKGGYAMELRIRMARTTKDIDFTLRDREGLSADPKRRREQVRATLQEAAATAFHDHFVFSIEEAKENLDGAPDGGGRYPVQAQMDGRLFAGFHIDIGIGDEVLEPLDVLTGEDWLGFAGVGPPCVPVISAEQQFAEKLHAYTLPRGERVNTRTKDLIDMVLLIRSGTLDSGRTAAALRATFARRSTHRLPKELHPPPAEWESLFEALAQECDLAMDVREAFKLLREFVATLTPPNP